MKKRWLALIILLALSLRLYRLDSPLADWHSWRQADTSAVSRNFAKRGFDLFHPRFDDLSSAPSGLENPEGYRFVEFPVYNLFQALFFQTFPIFSLEVWGRLVSILFSLVALVFLYLLVEKYLGPRVALFSTFFFAVLPYNIYYSRVILPEPMMVMTSLGMIYFWGRWIEENSNVKTQMSKLPLKSQSFLSLISGVIFGAISFLLKPFTLFLLIPIVYLAWRKWRFNYLKWITLSLYLFVSLLPFLGWRWWVSHFPEGTPTYVWLFNEAGIRLKGAFFYWLFAERIGRLILGYWGLILLGLGLIVKASKKEGLFFYSWLGAILVYFVIIAGGNVRHDYYQVLAIPIICIFLAKGVDFLLTVPQGYFSRVTCYLLLVVCCLFMIAFSWYQVRDFFNINNPAILEAGRAVDRLLPSDAKVIAPYGGDTAFLYQTKRQGWPIGIEIEKMIRLGATHYVDVNFDAETEWVMAKYKTLEKTDCYVIVQLQ